MNNRDQKLGGVGALKILLLSILFQFLILASNISIASEKEYIIGVEYDQKFPFHYIVNGEYRGEFRDILDRFAKIQKIKFKYVAMDAKILYQELFQGRIDFKFPDNPAWKAHKKTSHNIHYSNAITHSIEGVFVRVEDLDKSKSEFNIYGVANDMLLRGIDKKAKSGKLGLIKSTSCAELISMLERKEVDAIFCNYDVANYLIKKSSLDGKIVFSIDHPLIDSYYYLSSIKYPEILKKLNIWIESNREFIEQRTHEQ